MTKPATNLRDYKDTSMAQAWTPLVAINRSRGDARSIPMFAVHALDGHVLRYVALARCLRRPVFGLEARGFTRDVDPCTRVGEMATQYIDAMLAANPRGPFAICGYSFWGVVAYEMARQLDQRGEPVDLLALIDTPVPVSGTPPGVIDDETYWLWAFGKDLDITSEGLKGLNSKEQAEYVVQRMRLEGPKKGSQLVRRVHLNDATIVRILLLEKCHTQALWHYAPSTYAGSVTLLRAKDQAAPPGSTVGFGWEKLAKSGVDIRLVPGNHFTLFQSPYVELLADELTNALLAAEGRQT